MSSADLAIGLGLVAIAGGIGWYLYTQMKPTAAAGMAIGTVVAAPKNLPANVTAAGPTTVIHTNGETATPLTNGQTFLTDPTGWQQLQST